MVETTARDVRRAIPPYGRVSLLSFTDEQYRAIDHFDAGKVVEPREERRLVAF